MLPRLFVLSWMIVPLLPSCKSPPEAKAEADASSQTRTSSAVVVANVEVPSDHAVRVVEGRPDDRRVLVYLHGMCADPKEDLDAWGIVAKEHGTIIALTGDVPCPEKPGRRKWSDDIATIDARITSAIDSASARRPEKLDASDVVVIGESMGAARAESLATKFPARYPRLVLVGSPQKPNAQNLKGAKAIANVAGEKEMQGNMRAGARALENAGLPSRFFLLPEATHGNYGPEGVRVMDEAIRFVRTPDATR
jgi:pimeloyl-ACP methyl ester carboxylesterase